MPTPRRLFTLAVVLAVGFAGLPVTAAPPADRPVLVLDPGTHTGFVKSAAFLPDGRRFVTFSEDKTIRVWDVMTGLTVKTIHLPSGPGSEGALFAGAVSPDGRTVAAAGFPFGGGKHGVPVYLVSLETGDIERVFKGHRNVVSSVSFSHDGTLLATASADKTVLIYRVANGAAAGELVGHADAVNRVQFHPKTNHLATACQDGTARIWAPGPRGYAAVELKGHTAPVNTVAWSPDGATLATAGVDGAVRTWSKAGKPGKVYDPQEVTQTGRKGTAQVVTMAFTKDGKRLVYGGVAYLGTAGVLDLDAGTWSLFPHHSNSVMAAAVAPNGETAVTSGGDDNETVAWRVADGSVVQRLAGDSKSGWAVAWANDGVVAWGTTNRGSAVPPTRRLEHAFSLARLDFVPLPPAVVPAQVKFGATAVTQPDFFTLAVTKDGRPHYTHTVPEKTGERIYSATLLPDDKLVVGTSARLVLVDLATKQVVRTFVGQAGIVTAVAPSPDGFFATVSTDQVVRVWKPDRDEPVVSLFVAGREWIAWVPDGYYAASPGGERLMGWQVNDGPDRAARFYPAIQFRRTLYQPDVIRNLGRAGGDVAAAVALANKTRKVPVPAATVTQVLPPQVAIVTPTAKAGGVPAAKDTIEVKAAARGVGANPVKTLRLLVDGRPYLGPKGVKAVVQPKAGDATATWTVTLPPGRHTLAVLADTGVSTGLSAPVEVVRPGEPAKPVLYVYAVGVNEYPGKLKLNYAVPDAKSIAAVFEARTAGVFAKVEVKVVTDRDATRANVLKGLDWLAASVTATDVGVFYFSGHGTRDDDGAFYLVPVDLDPRKVAASCVPGDAVRDKLAGVPGRVVAVFDACHSGAAAEDVRVGGPDALVRELLTDDCGVVVLCSSLGDEVSLESGEQKAGLFTFGLVEGLNGKADLNGDGVVYIHEAAGYAAARVRQLTRGAQHPTLGRSPNLRPFPLTAGPADPKPR